MRSWSQDSRPFLAAAGVENSECSIASSKEGSIELKEDEMGAFRPFDHLPALPTLPMHAVFGTDGEQPRDPFPLHPTAPYRSTYGKAEDKEGGTASMSNRQGVRDPVAILVR